MPDKIPTPRTTAAWKNFVFNHELCQFVETLEREIVTLRETLLATTERLEALDPTSPQAARARVLLNSTNKTND